MTDSACSIVYPVNWLYELDGRRYIDTDESRKCTIPLDVQIPLTLDFFEQLVASWQGSGDVVLDYAVQYLSGK